VSKSLLMGVISLVDMKMAASMYSAILLAECLLLCLVSCSVGGLDFSNKAIALTSM
jgi:hypothetical protein